MNEGTPQWLGQSTTYKLFCPKKGLATCITVFEYRCMAKKCKGDKACPAFTKECFDCGRIGHFKGAKTCKYAKKKKRARRVNNEESNEESNSSSEENSSSTENSTDEGKTTQRLQRISIRKIGKVRQTKKQFTKQNSRYQVKVIINEMEVKAFADTRADINIMSLETAKRLYLPHTKTEAKIKPYYKCRYT